MIQLNSQPSATINFIGNPILFKFTMTSVESGNEVRRMGYQLFNESNEPLSALESCSPSEGQPFTLNFQGDVISHIYTEVPEIWQPGVDNIRSENSMLINIKLKYWEIVYNKETCKSEIQNEVITSVYPVLNATDQYFGYTSSNILGGVILTLKPKVIQSHSNDLFYFWSNGSTQFKLRLFTKVNGVISELGGNTETKPAGVYSYHTTIFYNYPNIYKIILSINDFELCTYYYDKCCDNQLLYFQQSGGGYSTMEFSLESKEVNSSFSEIFRYQPKESSYVGPYSKDTLQKGGRMIHNKRSQKILTLTKDIIMNIEDEDEMRYYEDFLSSGSYFYKFDSVQGQTGTFPTLVKFIVNSGSLRYYEKEQLTRLTITGYINQEHQRINNHV